MTQNEFFIAAASNLEKRLESLYVCVTFSVLLFCIAFAILHCVIRGFSSFILMQTIGIVLLALLLGSVILFIKKKSFKRDTLQILQQFEDNNHIVQNANSSENEDKHNDSQDIALQFITFLQTQSAQFQLSYMLFTSNGREVSG